MTLRRTVYAGLISVLSWLAIMPVQAKLPDRAYWRWFEVEVLLFKHTVEQDINETFPASVTPIPVAGSYDLLTPYINRDFLALVAGLEPCPQWPLPGADATRAEPLTLQIDCQFDHERELIPIPGNPLAPQPRIATIEQTDVVIDGNGGDIHSARAPFLLPKSTHVLSETRRELERKGLAKPLLHVAWRQPVFGKRQNYTIRLFGGQQFSDAFRYDGFAVDEPSAEASATELALLDRVEQLLDAVNSGNGEFSAGEQQRPQPLTDNNQPERVWELDGLLHVFLIGNYLHIDNTFNLRDLDMLDLTPADLEQQAEWILQGKDTRQPFLRAYLFDQLRRVISHETHYFDHPNVGMVIQIRRTDLSARRY